MMIKIFLCFFFIFLLFSSTTRKSSHNTRSIVFFAVRFIICQSNHHHHQVNWTNFFFNIVVDWLWINFINWSWSIDWLFICLFVYLYSILLFWRFENFFVSQFTHHYHHFFCFCFPHHFAMRKFSLCFTCRRSSSSYDHRTYTNIYYWPIDWKISMLINNKF